jgi:hypothetical protein
MFPSNAKNCGCRTTETICSRFRDFGRHVLFPVVAAACWTGVAAPGAAQTYRGVDLYTLAVPDGFDYPREYGELKASGGQVVGFPRLLSTGYAHALLWNHDATVVDLHPTSLGMVSESRGRFTNGIQQVGAATTISGFDNAVLWNGSAATAINLHPTNLLQFASSDAYFTDGSHQVGAGGTIDGPVHALYWAGTAASAVDLHPINLNYLLGSQSLATDGGHHTGVGLLDGMVEHALFWNSTTNSATDLHPTNLAGFIWSRALGVAGAQQVGKGRNSIGLDRALLWTGSASSTVNLHPSQLGYFLQSSANSTNGARQAGAALTTTGSVHALLWSGTAASAIDLHPLLPPMFTDSTADTIDAEGNVFGTALDDSGLVHAVMWSPFLLGDYNENGVVDVGDYTVFRNTLGQTGQEPFSGADGSGNGTIGPEDYDVWKIDFGQTLPQLPVESDSSVAFLAQASVGEPSSSILLAAVVTLILAVWRGSRFDSGNSTAFRGTKSAPISHVRVWRSIQCPSRVQWFTLFWRYIP